MFYAATYCIQSCLWIGHNNQRGKQSSLLQALLPLQITSAWSHVSQSKKDCYGELHKMFLNQRAWCSAYTYNLLLTFRKAEGPGWSRNISNLKNLETSHQTDKTHQQTWPVSCSHNWGPGQIHGKFSSKVGCRRGKTGHYVCLRKVGGLGVSGTLYSTEKNFSLKNKALGVVPYIHIYLL